MRRLELSELEARCQKLGHRELGTWMARKVGRPMALRVTQTIAPWGISANAVTLWAWALAVAAAGSFAIGATWSWIVGSVLWQLWYLLDHVDGQLARLRRTESLDGVALDYLMHHTLHLLMPLGLCGGIAACRLEPLWVYVGVVWSLALLLLHLQADVRYKAFIQRLKRVEGQLLVAGGAGGRPSAENLPSGAVRRVRWLAAKLCETHVQMNLIAVTSLAELVVGDGGLMLARVVVLILAGTASMRAAVALYRMLGRQQAEREYSAWYRPPANAVVVYQEGWWRVHNMPGPHFDVGASASS